MNTASDSVTGALSGAGLTYAYGNVDAIRGVSLQLRKGDALALVGPNGSGKTTLLTLFSGLRTPRSGMVSVNGTELSALSPRARARFISVVSQHLDPKLMFTVEHLVGMGRTPHSGLLRALSDNDWRAVQDALQATGATHLSRRRFGELSGGEQQRVMLAMALAQQTPYLLLDEPTVHLDLEHQHRFLELLHDLHATRGIGVLAVMHDLNLAALYFERLAVMSQGTLVAEGSSRELLQLEDVLQVFRAPLTQVLHPDADVPQVLLRPEHF